jgi:C1A family cysteine protease
MKNYKFNVIPSPVDNRDVTVEAVYYGHVELPEEYDIRPLLRPVKDQGTQGSCSAQVAALIKEYHEKKELNIDKDMSVQFVYNSRSNRHTEGMTPRDTMNILHNIGIVPEKIYPYGTRDRISKSMLDAAANLRIEAYGRVETIIASKMTILGNGPLYFALPVYNPDHPLFWIQDSPTQQMLGGHAVALVGWNRKGFILRNSWSDKWGDNGYTVFPYDHWGIQWEAWSALDADSCIEKLRQLMEKGIQPKTSNKKGCFASWFNIFKKS